MFDKLKFLNFIARERPVGTQANNIIMDYMKKEFRNAGYTVTSLPFSCLTWEKTKSFLKINEDIFEIFPSPFSRPFKGNAEILFVQSMDELQKYCCEDKIIILNKDIAKEPIQPKNFPFYYPDEHKSIITLLENKHPKAIIAATGKHPICGLNPFPLFEDGNLTIPSAYMKQINNLKYENAAASISIGSKNSLSCSSQLVALKSTRNHPKGKIVICAHMDSKYDTPGALDNAAGLAVMLEMMYKLRSSTCDYDIDFVPFNSEEYFGVNGELEYLQYIKSNHDKIKLVINIDSPCHLSSMTAISFYNMSDKALSQTINNSIIKGQEWYAGDHSMFASQGIPCIAVTSSDLFESALEITHTKLDTIGNINLNLIADTSDFLAKLITHVAAIF